MTTLQVVLDDRFILISQKEELIRQLQNEIAQHRAWHQAAEGVSSTLDSAKDLFFNAMTSFYALMQHEPEEVRQAAVEKVWDDFEKLDTQAQEHVANRRALVFEQVSDSASVSDVGASEVFDNNLSESETNLSEFDANLSDNLSEPEPETTITVVGEPVDSDKHSDNNPSESEELLSDNLRSDTNEHRLLTAEELKKDRVDWQTLKALCRKEGVTSKKRPEMEAELLRLGVTNKDLDEVQTEF